MNLVDEEWKRKRKEDVDWILDRIQPIQKSLQHASSHIDKLKVLLKRDKAYQQVKSGYKKLEVKTRILRESLRSSAEILLLFVGKLEEMAVPKNLSELFGIDPPLFEDD